MDSICAGQFRLVSNDFSFTIVAGGAATGRSSTMLPLATSSLAPSSMQ